jgi:hypothetical protein
MHDRDKTKPKTRIGIAEAAADPKTKLQARAIANDCYRYIMDLCTNAGIVSDALKLVKRNSLTRKQKNITPYSEHLTSKHLKSVTLHVG